MFLLCYRVWAGGRVFPNMWGPFLAYTPTFGDELVLMGNLSRVSIGEMLMVGRGLDLVFRVRL